MRRPGAKSVSVICISFVLIGISTIPLCWAEGAYSTKFDDPQTKWEFTEGLRLESKEPKDAIPHFDSVIKTNPRDWRSFFHRGVCLLRTEKNDAAKLMAEKALELEPKSPDALLLLAEAQTRLREQEPAIKTLNKFLADYPNDRRSFHAKVILVENYGRAEKKDEAAKLAMEALSDPNRNAKDMLWLSSMLNSIGRLDLEATLLRQFKTNYPDDPRANDSLRTADRVERDYKEASEPDPRTPWVTYLQEHMPIKVAIIAAPEVDKRMMEVSRKGFDEWEKVTDKLVRFEYVHDQENADIVYEWTANNQATRARGANLKPASAECQQKRRKDGTMQKWIVATNEPKSELEFYIRGVHEIGHALGLKHSLEPDDVMCGYRSFHDLPTKLSANDVKRILALYTPAKTYDKDNNSQQ